MNLTDKFLELIKNELTIFGMQDFSGFDNTQIIAMNMNLKSKMINNKVYEIFESPQVIEKINNLNNNYLLAFDEIKTKLQNGEDVNPFLSKQAVKPKFNDYLLLDWGIHHFHLNKSNSGNYFNDRSDYLLIARIKDDKVYFIDIEHHDNSEVFVKQEYLKIILDNWSDILKPYEFTGKLSYSPSNDEIKKLRKNQINSSIQIKDKFYMPMGGGITTSGDGEQHIIGAMQILKYIKHLEEHCKNNLEVILNDIENKVGKRFSSLDLDFIYQNRELMLIDKNSNLILAPIKV